MSTITKNGEAADQLEAASRTDAPTETDFYEILSNPRRRYTIHYLKFHDEAVDLGKLAEQLAAWEQDIALRNVTSTQRKRTYTALQQEHLPKMDELNLIDFERRAGVVKPAGALSDIDIYTEVVSGRSFPWSDYYLGLSAFCGALLFAAEVDAPLFGALPDVAWGVFCVTAFGVSAVAHAILTRKMKVGRAPKPPELEG